LPADPRLRPTPDYGSFGPGTDIRDTGAPVTGESQNGRRKPGMPSAQILAVLIGFLAALIAGVVGKSNIRWDDIAGSFSNRNDKPASAKDSKKIDHLNPQRQAETLLELAVSHSDGAADQISSRVSGWPGKVRWNSQIATLTAAALNSDDLRTRESGIEVELAAYGLAKNSTGFEYVLKLSQSPDHAHKIWALWALGLMANRGVETDRAMEALISHVSDTDVDSRRWAVEGLALAGTDQAIGVLLKSMHDDESPVVRERAACGLAESGMFTREQRLTAVPKLLTYTDDSALDAQTRGWSFQALGDITHQRLPSTSQAWRIWYEKQSLNR
jgi:HEAT repeats